jgi:HTH-type transcriptional regulator / antitoxin HigA
MKNKKQTFKQTKDILPAHATHPGQLIADEIEFRELKQKELADTMQIAPNILNEIIHGKRNITAPVALKLEKALGIEAIYWMRLQVKYDIDSLKIEQNRKRAA